VRHRLEYLIVRTLIASMRLMPFWLVERCGALLGLAFYAFDGSHRRIAERNVAGAFPSRPARERRVIVRGAFAHFGRLLFALLKFSTLSPRAMRAREEVEVDEHVLLT
jgi:lauroyl/myristoyl acyltransferase